MTVPAFIDDGNEPGTWADAIRHSTLRQIGPDTFANFAQDPSARHSDSDDFAGPAFVLSHTVEVTDA